MKHFHKQILLLPSKTRTGTMFGVCKRIMIRSTTFLEDNRNMAI
ncbi:MAG: hypothetical protein ABIG93_05295 [archaeon]